MEIMKHIDALCREHGIVYYIMGGTVLGVIRHGGFIPWDDNLDIPFEDMVLLGSKKIKEYLSYRYGDYMQHPSKEAQAAAVHAYIFDTENDYTKYIQ